MRFVRKIPVVLLLLLPVIVVSATVLYYAVNIPYWDDYLVQDQLQMLVRQPTWMEQMQHLFDQHWEHRIVWTRLIFLAFYRLNGSLNYYDLTLIGVSGLFILTGILFAAFRKLNLPLVYFIPVPFWLCTLQSHENLIWAMASLQNFYVLVFVTGTFYALALNTSQSRITAAGLATLATFTSGNGVLALLIGLCVLVLQRHTRWAIAWAVLTGLCLFAYFTDYRRVDFFPSPFSYSYVDWIKAYFVFLGGFLDPYPYSGSMAVGYRNPLRLIGFMGLVMAVAITYFVVTGQFRSRLVGRSVSFWDDFFTAIGLFILATAAITVFSRVGFAGPGYMLQGRYKVYPALTLSSVYLYSLHRWGASALLPKYATVVATTTALFSLFTSYLCLEGIINQHRRAASAYINWLSEASEQTLVNASYVYKPTQQLVYTRDTTLLNNRDLLITPATAHLNTITEGFYMYNLAESDANNPTPAQPLDGSYIVLKNPTHSYLFAARPRRPSPMAVAGLSTYFTPSAFYTQILKENLIPGTYRVGVLSHQAGRSTVQMTDQYVTFKGF